MPTIKETFETWAETLSRPGQSKRVTILTGEERGIIWNALNSARAELQDLRQIRRIGKKQFAANYSLADAQKIANLARTKIEAKLAKKLAKRVTLPTLTSEALAATHASFLEALTSRHQNDWSN
ncbi:hypothetical protein A2721_02425 [Candidatus Gottesmanbacteria bacterium RIFCSPHIGHO2_01_FULL_47_48]|uniref:Uncharacterized protein n=1 Tax=Candidatus Gottesmanbacteria bacterium RIFCSPHIGHO2_01_FULL_47_48 TaxID=1798381 RepID=A0A1F6A3C7_9BACT|nr:MAG: hypothetical protein A2721_02425 [Candidatus Gottesmanbacteria bacterium RIFCSPHIGHO2_01_FULL_47_48]